MKTAACTLVILLACSLTAGDAPTLTLTGDWAGKWTDSRPEYSKSGGEFSCNAVEKAPNVWTCTFKLGKTREWTVELKGKPQEGKLVFGGQVDLGEVQGVYVWKGTLSATGFTGEYDGPDEKGTFKMERLAAKPPEKK